MSDAPNFMQSPLAVWIQTFSFEPVSYKDLIDGIYLNEVLLQIDPKASLDGIKNNIEDSKDRVANWEILLRNISLFYRDVLDYYVVMKPPSIYSVCIHPESEAASLEVRKSLHLLLGCAINCEMKGVFIDRIRSLPEDIQVSMMSYIQELQDINSNVIGSRLLLEGSEKTTWTVYGHLTQLIQQRDEYLQEIKSLRSTIDEAEFDQSFLNSISIMDSGVPETISRFAPSVTITKSHKNRLVVELAECKAKLRKLRHDLEDRDDAVSELEMEVDSLKQTMQKLKNENLELTRDARAVKSFQDELDSLQEKASRCERLEAENQRFKEKMVDLDFFKSRVEELRQDNGVLFESRSVMEEQLKAAHKWIETVKGLENELKKYKEQRDALILECDRHRIQAQNLIEENSRLEHERQAITEAQIEEELQGALDAMHKGSSNSLYDQLSQAVNSQVLRLELENQRLKQDLEQIKESTMLENASKMLALEKENSRLAAKVDKFLETAGREEQRCLDLKNANQELTREKKNLEETIEVLKEMSERQVKELEKENSQLSQNMQALRDRSEKTNDLRVKDLETENKKLGESMKGLLAQVAQLEHERKTLNRRSRHLMDEAERCRAFETESRKLELANEELRRNVDSLELSSSKQLRLESELSALEVENQKLVRTVEALQKVTSEKEALKLENSSLTSEVQNLKQSLGSATASKSRIDVLEKEAAKLSARLEQSLEQSEVKGRQLEKLERENFSLNAEKQENQKNLASLKERIREGEQELEIQESHNAQLLRKIEDLKRSYRHLEDVEAQLKDLETEVEKVKKDKSVATKENKKLKQNLLVKESAIDDLTSKLTELDLEFKTLAPMIERSKDLEFNLSELEKENLGIIQSATIDKKTIGTLREDLVHEKIRCQQLQTDLENMKRQLTSVAITNEKSVMSGMAQDEGTFRTLESRMEGVYEKRIKSQEEQIRLLEKRVDEYKSQVKKMQSQIESSKNSGDDASGRSPSKERTLVVTQRYSNSPNATQDIINLKDHIIKLERVNATLEEENRNIKRQNSELQEHIKQLQAQISMWQAQLLSFQTQHNNMQSQLATSEVENRTLLSENASLSSQNSLLQDQCSRAETLVSHFRRQHEEFAANHDALEKDLGKLQNVHDQLTVEHEELVVKHASLRDVYRGSKADVKHLQQRCSELSREKEMIAQLKAMLERDKENLKSESHQLESLQADYFHVREDNLRLLNANDKVNGELGERQKELRVVKAEVLQLKTKIDELAMENADLNKQIGDRNAEHSKQVFRLEETLQWAAKLEEDNQSLMVQMKLLISQNQDLLTKLLESKDQHIFEQKAYVERLAELRQQKERLEERFMEQHRRYDPVKNKQRSITANFVKKAKQMIKGKSRENGNAGSSLDGSGVSPASENASCGSGSVMPVNESLTNHDRNEVSAGLDSWNQSSQNKARNQRSTGVGNSLPSNTGNSSREISTNTAAEKEDFPISLDEFLHECNQSPKSRRKLLVEKQVALDENIESVSDITQKPLRPRRPTIHEESSDRVKGLLKPFRSEMNISSRTESDKRHRTLPNKTSFESSPMLSTPSPARPKVRPVVASRSVSVQQGDCVGKGGVDREQQVQWYHRNAQVPKSAPISSVPRRDQATGSVFTEQSATLVPESRRTRATRSQSCYEGQFAVSPGGRETTQPGCISGGKEEDRRAVKYEAPKNPASSSSGSASRVNDAHAAQPKGKPREQPHSDVDLRPVKLRPESKQAEVQQRAKGGAAQNQHSAQPSPALDPTASCDPGLASQYNPGNVRNLVHSFQQAVVSPGASSPQHSTPKDRTDRPRSAVNRAPNGSGNSSAAPRTTTDSQMKPEDRSENGGAIPRPESTVCVVRPTSGRTLPPNPSEQPNPSNARSSGVRSDSAAGPADGASASARSAKPKVFLDYGLL